MTFMFQKSFKLIAMDEFDSRISFGVYIYIHTNPWPGHDLSRYHRIVLNSLETIVAFMQALVALAALCLRTLGVDAD